jgi:signal transduction histidine kinase
LQLLTENADKLDAKTVSAYYHQLLKSADGLVDLLKNLLNWALIQTGRHIYQPSPINLVGALRSDIEVTKSMAARKEVVFEATTPTSALINADENMVVTVVRNLLANAVKFTAKGGQVTLDISQSGKDVARNVSTYVISVADTGAGMTPEQIQTLFRIDRKQSREGTAGEKGTGLGLIVCKEFIEKHGSTLHVESEAGKGSRFWFELSS